MLEAVAEQVDFQALKVQEAMAVEVMVHLIRKVKDKQAQQILVAEAEQEVDKTLLLQETVVLEDQEL